MGWHSNVQAQCGIHSLLLRVVGLYAGIAMCRCIGMDTFLCICFGSSPSDTYLALFALCKVICNPEQKWEKLFEQLMLSGMAGSSTDHENTYISPQMNTSRVQESVAQIL